MAFSFSRIGHDASHQWESWTITGAHPRVTGDSWWVALITGRTSTATAYIVSYATDFSFRATGIYLIRLNGTAFTAGEICDISGGGYFTLGTRSATATYPMIVVTGTSTNDFFDDLETHISGAGYGYSTKNNGVYNLTCGFFIGAPDQTAATTAVSTGKSVETTGSWFVAGNATYKSTFTCGIGTFGSETIYSGLRGVSITAGSSAMVYNSGSTRYGKVIGFSSNFRPYSGGWEADLQNCHFGDTIDFGGMALIYLGRTVSSSEKMRLINNNISEASLVLSHPYVEAEKLYIGGYDYGIIPIGSGDTSIRDMIIKDTVNYEIYGFTFLGNAYLIDTNLTKDSTINGFWSTGKVWLQYSINIKVVTKDGLPIEDVVIRAWDGSLNPLSDTPNFNVTTDADGVIDEQLVTYCKIDTTTGTVTDYNDFYFLIQKAGWRDIKIVKTLSEKINLTLTLEDYDREDDVRY